MRSVASKAMLGHRLLVFLLLISQAWGGEVDKTYATRDAKEEELKTCNIANENSGECINPDATKTTNTSTESSSESLTTNILCLDDRDECPQYAARGGCETNPKFMRAHCKLSCNACPANLNYLESDWGEPQEISGENPAAIENRVQRTEKYMKTKVYKMSMYQSVRDSCLNRGKLCTKWAIEGECEKNPSWMLINCAPACFSCEKIDHRIRCPYNPMMPKIWGPGDVDEMFVRITTDPHYFQFQPRVLSRPPQQLTSLVPAVHETRVPQGDAPWVMELQNFLTPEECDRLIHLGGQVGYKQSYEVGGKEFDGTYGAVHTSDRTSFNAWCFEKQCYEDEITQQILAKIENVTGVPEKHYEFFQLLRYEEGGLYKRHSDYVPGDFERSQGVRVLTVLIYLNDMEDNDSGGETAFPRLGLKITPKKGKAVLWPNVYMRNPDARDARTEHEALPVKKGIKYAANLWIHQRDFKTPFYDLCN